MQRSLGPSLGHSLNERVNTSQIPAFQGYTTTIASVNQVSSGSAAIVRCIPSPPLHSQRFPATMHFSEKAKKNEDGKYTLTKTGDDNLVFDKVDLPSPQKEYSIETNSDGVSFLKDGDELLKSCDETMNEILQSDSVKTGLINQKYK